MRKRLSMIALSLSLAISMPAQTLAMTLNDFTDTPSLNHWSYKGLDYAVKQGFIKGDNGKLMPNSSLTRSQMGAIINRMFDSSEKASLSNFTDIEQGAWYADDMAKALKMGTLTGRSDTKMEPNAKITRQEVFSIMSRLLSNENTNTENLDKFTDSDDISDWAKSGVSYLIDKKIISGSENKINPLGNISRQEFATLLFKAFPNVVKNQEDLQNLVDGNTLIVGNIDIKDTKFNGDLILADGVKSKIKIENVDVSGNLIIRGGDIDFKNLNIAQETIINNPNGPVNLSGDKMNKVNAKTPVVLEKGEFSTVVGKDVKVEKATVKSGDVQKTPEKAKDDKTQKSEKSSSGGGSGGDGSSSDDSSSSSSEKILYGEANIDQRKYPLVAPFVHPPFFNAKIKVTLGSNGKIIKVEDNGTEAGRNKRYWEMSTKAGLFEKFVGKTLEEVKAMKMDKGEVDVITGATANSLAVQEAVINAITGKKGRGFLKPDQTLKANPVMVDSGTTEIKFENTLPEDFDIELVSVSYSIYNTEKEIGNVKLSEDGTSLTVPNNLKPGHYYVNIKDKNGNYRSPDFETGHGTERHYPYFVVKNTAQLTFEDETLKVSSGTLEEVFENIEHIIITENVQGAKSMEIEPIGHHGTKSRDSGKTLFEDDGKIKPNAKVGRRTPMLIFTKGKQYNIEIQVWGFEEPLKFLYTADKTNAVLEGDANIDQRNYPIVAPFIHPPFYNARVKVEVDSNGKIVTVMDNETAKKGWDPKTSQEFWDRKNKPYWDKTLKSEVFKKFEGKSLDEVKAMQMDTGQVDVVSGATENGLAIQEAIINAFEQKAGKKFLEAGQTLKAESSMIDSGTTEIRFENKLPDGFKVKLVNVVHTIYNSAETTTTPAVLGAILSEDGTSLTVPSDLKPGHYYVNIIDENKNYRSPDFEVRGENRNYPYFVVKNTADIKFEQNKLTTSDNDIKNILDNIKEIVVKEKDSENKPLEIEIVGHHGTISQNAKNFFKEDGEINKEAKAGRQNKPVFENGKTYEIQVHIWGVEEPVKTEYTAEDINITPPPVVPPTPPTNKEKFVEENTVDPLFKSYPAKLKVVLNQEDIIVSVEDNGTIPGASKMFWDTFINGQGLEKYKGKNKAQVEAMQVGHKEVDSIAGATVSAETVKKAVLKAFE